MLFLLLFYALVLSCVLLLNEEKGVSFIGGEEGVIWKMLHPLMEGTKLTSKYVKPGQNHHTDVRQGGKHQPTESWAKRGQWGCGHTMVCSKLAHLHWASSCYLLHLAHGGVVRS